MVDLRRKPIPRAGQAARGGLRLGGGGGGGERSVCHLGITCSVQFQHWQQSSHDKLHLSDLVSVYI